jgi:ankyrin repeat protein
VDPELVQAVVNAGDEEGWTPLHSAVSIGHIPVVEVLLEAGKKHSSVNIVGLL